MHVNDYGYLAGRGKSTWIVRGRDNCKGGSVPCSTITFQERHVGKRVRFKVEFVDEIEPFEKELKEILEARE